VSAETCRFAPPPRMPPVRPDKLSSRFSAERNSIHADTFLPSPLTFRSSNNSQMLHSRKRRPADTPTRRNVSAAGSVEDETDRERKRSVR